MESDAGGPGLGIDLRRIIGRRLRLVIRAIHEAHPLLDALGIAQPRLRRMRVDLLGRGRVAPFVIRLVDRRELVRRVLIGLGIERLGP
ncbi:unannotated protein [freshwater metagenome]|uniref:Unannotated protein n=1 Tax=freshwater metagenome TaxID=449393 RepID=A0A6J6ULH6_9ZZZZ